MNLSRLQRYLLSLSSGLLLFLAFPFTGSCYPLAFIAFIPLLLIEHHCYIHSSSTRKVFFHAYLTFVVFNSGSTFWIYYAQGGEVGAVLAYFLNSLLMAIVFVLFHLTKRKLGVKVGMISFIVLWLGFEFMHFHWELSWPWLNLGNVFAIVPQFVQWYSITGVLGGSLWILIVNVLFFYLIINFITNKKKPQIKSILICLGIVLFPALFSYYIYSTYKESHHPKQVIATQPNIDPYTEKFSTSVTSQLKKIIDEAATLLTDSTAIVLAPETAIAKAFNEKEYNQSTAYLYLKKEINSWKDVPLYIGASTYNLYTNKTRFSQRKIPNSEMYYESYNTSVLLRPYKAPEFVHKSKLVLGVEKLPFTKWLPFIENLSLDFGGTSGTLGIEDEAKVMTANGITFAPVVCYESIYGEWVAKQCRKGAEVIFIITNDAWWGDSPGYKQHASFARLRAIETRRYVVRSANTGISCFINQRGDVLQTTDFWVQDAIRDTVQLNNQKTFYIKFGDVIGKIAFLLFWLIILINIGYRFFNKKKKVG